MREGRYAQYTNTNEPGPQGLVLLVHTKASQRPNDPWRALLGSSWNDDRVGHCQEDPGRIARHRGIGVICVMAGG